MLTAVDFMLVVTVVAGAASGGLVAAGEGRGTETIIFCAVGGLLFAFLAGQVANKSAWSTLNSKRLNPTAALFLYITIPFVSFLLVVFTTVWLVKVMVG